jgi:hypothetical protein
MHDTTKKNTVFSSVKMTDGEVSKDGTRDYSICHSLNVFPDFALTVTNIFRQDKFHRFREFPYTEEEGRKFGT